MCLSGLTSVSVAGRVWLRVRVSSVLSVKCGNGRWKEADRTMWVDEYGRKGGTERVRDGLFICDYSFLFPRVLTFILEVITSRYFLSSVSSYFFPSNRPALLYHLP